MTTGKFYNRSNYLDILNKRIKGLKDGYRQNIALLGDELIGKTSIILHFLNNFNDSLILPVYLAVKVEEFEYFARRFIGVLLYNFLINSGEELEENLDFLIKKSDKYIPQTVEKVKNILSVVNKKKKDAIFTELFSLCDTIYKESHKSCVVVLDEFHNLESMRIKNLYKEWARLLVLQKNTMFLITSSAKFKAKKILSENLSLLFGNFEIINVLPFDSSASDQLLKQRLGRFGLDKDLKNFLISFSGGSPFYLEVFAAALCKIHSQETQSSTVSRQTVIDALQDMLFEETGTINQRFHSYLRNLSEWRVNQDYIWVLYCIANGYNRIKDMMGQLHKQKRDILKILSQLMELDVIDKNGDFYKINDKIFSFWLKFVHQNKTGALNFDANSQREGFRVGINNLINEFVTDAHKDITERIGELLHLFENEGVYINSKRLRLVNFREIKHLNFNRRHLKEGLIGRSSDALWIIAIKHDHLTEEDIAEFSRECKRYRKKVSIRIFISPIEIETNVRLKALEEKIWTWNLNNINVLFELFNKPEIIL